MTTSDSGGRLRAHGRIARLTRCAAVLVLASAALTACGGGSDDLCDVTKKLQETSPSDPSLDELADAFSKMADAAPDEIKDDLELIAEGFEDPTGADSAELTEAAARVDAYLSEECDIDLGDALGSASGDGPRSPAAAVRRFTIGSCRSYGARTTHWPSA